MSENVCEIHHADRQTVANLFFQFSQVEEDDDEADTEHHVVKFLLSELSAIKAGDDFYDSKVSVLCELVNHHVQQEEKEIFEKLEKSGADLEELGAAQAARGGSSFRKRAQSIEKK